MLSQPQLVLLQAALRTLSSSSDSATPPQASGGPARLRPRPHATGSPPAPPAPAVSDPTTRGRKLAAIHHSQLITLLAGRCSLG